MRFLIATNKHREEVIGEPFVIDQVPDEVFAVHRTHIGENGFLPYWTVTHVETGFAAAHGDTIDFAIQQAREKFASKTPEQIAEALTKARSRQETINALPVAQGCLYAEEDTDVDET
jgi:hypothetical protein